MKRISVVVLSVCLSLPARAEDPGIVAVLPLDNRDSALDGAQKITLEESIRTVAGDALTPLGYTVLTGENTLQVLADNGVSADKACEASCALQAARELKAQMFLSGTVARTEGQYVAFVRLFESKVGRLVGSVQLEGASVRDLRDQLEKKADKLFANIPVKGGRSNFQEGRIGGVTKQETTTDGEDLIVVSFDSSPPGAIVRVDGKIVCREAPCSKAITPGSHEVMMEHEGYDPAASRPKVERGTKVSLTLNPIFATTSIETNTPGISIVVNGKDVGPSPVRELHLDPGPYEIVVGDPCYEREGERIVLQKGQTRTVTIAAKLRTGKIRVLAQDERDNDVETDVLIDGHSVGKAPGVFTVGVCSREIALQGPGGLSWSGALQVKEKATTEIRATLKLNGDASTGNNTSTGESSASSGTSHDDITSAISLNLYKIWTPTIAVIYEHALKPQSSLEFGLGVGRASDSSANTLVGTSFETVTWNVSMHAAYKFHFLDHAPGGLYVGPYVSASYFHSSVTATIPTELEVLSGGGFGVGFGGLAGYNWIAPFGMIFGVGANGGLAVQTSSMSSPNNAQMTSTSTTHTGFGYGFRLSAGYAW